MDTTKPNDVTLLGGNQNDTLTYAIANFDNHDIVDGGLGNDTIVFNTAGTLTDTMLSSISNIEVIQLSGTGANTVTVDVSNIGSGSTTLIGGSSNDVFNYAIANLSNADKIMVMPALIP